MSFAELKIPSPIQEIHLPLIKEKGIELFIKRDDLIHPRISGNKWRKLAHNIEHSKTMKREALLTFGGAYSNHIAATAYACKLAGIKSIGIIRALDADPENPTLKMASENGMEIIRVSREEYAQKEEPIYLNQLHDHFGNVHIVPEGGANFYGVNGCIEIYNEITVPFDILCCACGTGTTISGIATALKNHQRVIGFPAVKGADFLNENIRQLLLEVLNDKEWAESVLEKITLNNNYHFGGYAKYSDELLGFIREFYLKTSIPLDFVYTGKLLYGLLKEIEANAFKPGTKIVVVHTGGLQGNAGIGLHLE